jgi:hypothetical protein
MNLRQTDYEKEMDLCSRALPNNQSQAHPQAGFWRPSANDQEWAGAGLWRTHGGTGQGRSVAGSGLSPLREKGVEPKTAGGADKLRIDVDARARKIPRCRPRDAPGDLASAE